MAWLEIKKGSSYQEPIGAKNSRSGRRNGLSVSTSSNPEAQVILLNSLASRMQRYCFGCENITSHDAQYLKQGLLSIGESLDQTIRCGTSAVNLTLGGLAGLLQNASCFTQANNGKMRACSCGNETRRRANGADCTDKSKWTCHSISTTLNHLLTAISAQIQQTLSCFAKSAIISSTQGEM